MTANVRYKLKLLGPFALFDPHGARVEVTTRKGAALIAMLATGRDGERTRDWLQDHLWGSRGDEQGKQSLRKELWRLNLLLNRQGMELLHVDRRGAALDLSRIELDIDAPLATRAAFLEGFEINGNEEGFEDWLRSERAAIDARRPAVSPPSPATTMERDGMSEASASAPTPVTARDTARPADRFFERPFLAVLPFVNLTGDPDNDYLGPSLAEDLIERLSRLRWIPIVARAASFRDLSKDGHVEIRPKTGLVEIGRELGARYVVEGRLLRSGNGGFTLNASISDAEAGQALWSFRTALPVGWAPDEVDAILAEVVGALSTQVDDAEMVRAVEQKNSGLRSLIWRARWLHNRYGRKNSEEAEALLLEALKLEPESPEATVQLADFRQREVWKSRGNREEILELRSLAQRAITADYLDGRGYLVAGIAELWLCHTTAAMTLFEEAIRLNPSLAYAYSQIGAAYYLSNRPELAIEPLERAKRLDMGKQHAYYLHGEFAMSRAMMGQWDAAVAAADKSLALQPTYWFAHLAKIHALVEAGEAARAHDALRALADARTEFEPSFIDWVPFTDDRWKARLKASLAAACRSPSGEEVLLGGA